jgi:hypothetical protein
MKNKKPIEIEITIQDGAVVDYTIPKGCKVVIKDYDVNDEWEGEDLRTDEDGDQYQEIILENEED